MKTVGFRHPLMGLLLIISTATFGSISDAPINKITICHYPPGNPENVQTITISESAWPAHEAHGDSRGQCTLDNNNTNDEDNDPGPCESGAVSGGEIAYFGPYNEDDDNVIYSNELASSPYISVLFEYVWMQNTRNEPDVIGNPNWQLIDGSENLEELIFADLTQTTYFVRCARIFGCFNEYWGKSNIVEVIVENCGPEFITGGVVEFDGPYDPNANNTIYNVELPYSEINDLGFEYIWMQSLTDVANTPGNPHWSPIAGTENLPELEVNGLLQTTFFIRCARLVGCDNYWGETPSVEVNGFAIPTAVISGGGEVCEGETASVNIDMTGVSPFTITYTDGTNEVEIISENTTISIDANEGVYTLISVEDFNYPADISGEAVVTVFERPTATLTGGGSICGHQTVELQVALSGSAPFTVVYSNGVEEITAENINENIYSIQATAGEYSLLSILDANCTGNVSGTSTIIQNEIPTATLSGEGSVCGDQTVELQVALSGAAPFTVVYSNGVEEITAENINENIYSIQASAGEYTLLSVSDSNCSGTAQGSTIISGSDVPTATIAGSTTICSDQTAPISITLTGEGPLDIIYTNGTETFDVSTSENIYTFDAVAGMYSLISVSNGQCEGTVNGEAVISISDSPTANISVEGSVCEGEAATVIISFTGAGNWTATYTDGNTPTSITSDSDRYTFEAFSGTFTLLSVSDASCSGTVSGTAIIENIVSPTAVISGGGIICGRDVATIEFSFTGTGPWDYSYMLGRNTITATSETSTASITTNQFGSYTLLSVSDALCTGTVSGSAFVTTMAAPSGSISIDDNNCVGEEIVLSNNINEAGNTFTWSTSGSGTLLDADTKFARYISLENEQNVSFNLIVTNDCFEVEFAAVTIFNSVSASFSINPAPTDGVLLSNVAYEFIADDTNASSWEWDFGDGTIAAGNTVEHTFTESGLYTVSLAVGLLDCSDTETLTVEVGENQNLFIPNVFSPRSTNPENSTLKVYGENISTDNFEFAVYNKWGQPVFRTNNLTDAQSIGWNGNSNSEEKGNNVFTYIVRGKFNNGETFEETGAVTLVR